MEIKKNSIVFQTDSDIIKAFLEKDNYIIEYNEQCKYDKICTIYFSSNDIYYPNTEQAFRERIIDKNYYEMYNTRISTAYKHIFVRDIQKQWYLGGINSNINSPELLFDFLKNETLGYSVICIGSSAGGYAAVLYGSLLNAKRVFSFNGQFELKTLLKTSNEEIDPLIFRLALSPLANYYDLMNYLNFKTAIYYFTSIRSDWDSQQYNHIRNVQSINTVFFKTSHHGVPFVKSALARVINMDVKVLNNIRSKKFNPILFSIKFGGFLQTFGVLYKQLKNKVF